MGILTKHWVNGEMVGVRYDALFDQRISLKAKGLYCVIQNIPSETDITTKVLIDTSADGWFAVRSALRELELFGYVKTTRERVK